MNYIDFSTRIKKKYPQYGNMDDRELAQRIVAKYPQYDVSFEEEATGEEAFQNWYNKASKEFNLDPNPDAPEHFYDYRSAFKAGAWPDETGHWPSEYKLEGHPRMVIDGVNTKTGERHIDASFQSESPDVVSTPALQGKQPSTSIAPYQGKKPQEIFAGTEDPFTQPEQKEEYKGNIVKDTYGSLEAGAANLASGIAKIPGALLDTYLTANNLFNKAINKATGANLKTDYKTPDIVYENGLTRFLEEDAKRYSVVRKKYQEKGEDLVSVISKGKVTDIAEYLYHSVLEQAPQLMGIAVAQMAGVPAWGTIGTLGGSSGAQKIDEIRKKVDSGELNTEKEVAILSGWINGLAEAGFEKMGSFKILEKLTSALKGAPKTVVANTLKNTFKGLLTGFAEEAKEEMATSITQNVVDYISGVNPDLTWEDIVREAFEEGTIGGLSGGVPGMAGGFAEGVSSRRIREGQTAQSQQAKTVRDNIRQTAEQETLQTKAEIEPQKEAEKKAAKIYKEKPATRPVLERIIEKTKPEVTPEARPEVVAEEDEYHLTKRSNYESIKNEGFKYIGDDADSRRNYADSEWPGALFTSKKSEHINVWSKGLENRLPEYDVAIKVDYDKSKERVIKTEEDWNDVLKNVGFTTKYENQITPFETRKLMPLLIKNGIETLRFEGYNPSSGEILSRETVHLVPENVKVSGNPIPVSEFVNRKPKQKSIPEPMQSGLTEAEINKADVPRVQTDTEPSQKKAAPVSPKTEAEDSPPEGGTQTLADKGITEQQFFELPDEERHKVFRDLSEEEQDYLLQWDGETEREIAETIDRIKRSAEEQKEIDKIETEPSEAQKEAGNYPKAHIKRDGLDISIENAAGSERSGKDETGKEWKQTINHDYGYVKGTKGPDKDHVDVFIKPGSSEGGTVYVVNQVNPNTQEFDEPKCMMGFESEAEAKEAYLSNYEENWQGLGSITPMSMDVFKKWVYSKDAKKKSPVTVADLKKYEQVKPEPKKESTAKKTETIQKEGFEQPSPEYSEDVIPKEDVPVIQIRKDEDKKPQQKMPGQGRKDMENRLGNIIGYSIIVADEKDLKESGTKEPLSQRDKRRERSYEDGKAIAKKLIDEIEDRNYAELVDRLSVLKNKGSRAAFTAYTGIKLPKTVSGTKSVIRTFVGKNVYNKHLESIKKKKEEAAQKQKQKAIEERNERLKEEKVTDNGRLTNNFDLIHRLVEDEGYTRLEEEKKGIATHYLIHNDEKERYYRFRKKDHGDLIKDLLEKQFGEVEITPPGVRVATKKDLDHLFGKDLKPEGKEKGTNKPADQNVISLKQEEFNAKENTKENQADTKAIKETGRSVRTVTSTRGGSHPRRQAAVKRSQPDESYSVEYWQAQHLHNLNVSLYKALRFGWKDRKGKSHPGMQPGWINDFNILTDSNILGGRRGKNLSSNAQFYLQDLVDSFNESPEYLAELASLGLEQPEHIDDIRMWLEQSLSASEFVEYHKGYEADLVPQTDMNKFNEALEVFQEDHTKLTPEQRRVLEESWQMDLDDVIARENALQEQSGSAIDEMWGEEKAEDLFEGTELAGPVTRSETSTKKKPQYETGDLFEGTALQETELGKELVRRREKKDKIKERGAEGLPLFETPDESNQTSLFEQGKESSEKYVQESAKIEDFGEKIGGARKDYYADFVSNLNSAVSHDIADVPLSKSWPQPDYNKLLDEGKDKWAVAFFRAARDEIGTKPQRSYRIKSWAEKVRFLRDFATQVLNGDISKESLLEHLNQAKFSDLAKHLLGRIELYETFGHDKSLKGIRLTKNHYSLYKGQKNVDKWLVEKDAKATAFGNMPRTLGEGDTKQEAIESFRKSYDSLGEGKSSATKFVAYTKRGAEGVYIGVKIGKNYVDLKRFDTSKEALEYKKGNTGELQALLDKYKDIPSERREFNRERIGKDHRGGADATPEMFDNVFGFRGVEFGNWVKDSERQENLNQAYDALMDLSTILNIPSRAISLNGELGLAFGSRGRGGKGAPSAHYEPSKIVINLTKKNGPGSLAHEWWHALDNYLSRKKGRKDDFQTVSSHVPGNVPLRPELAAAVGNVVEAIKKTGIKKRSENLDRRRSTPYWSTTIEMTARAFENYVINKLADLNVTNDYLANVATNKEYSDEIVDVVLSGETPRAEDMYPYILPEEMGGVIDGFDNLFNTIKTKVEDSGDVALYAKSDQVTKWPVDTSGKKVDPTQLEEYGFDEPLTHESGSDFDGIINKEGIFNGVFALEGLKGNALGSSGHHHTYIPRKDAVAREGSIDLDEERALDFIKNEYPDATQEQLEVIEAVAVRDKPLLDVVEDEYGEEDVVGFFNNLIYGDNAGEIEWVLQGLRGQIALDQGFDAIAMRDENGTSYLIPAGSKALYLGKVNSYDDLEKIKSAENTKGASFAKSDQTKTKEFKKWSGESPIIKIGQASHYKFKSGNPVVVEALHGSDKIFSVFEDSKLGANTGAKSAQKGHFFTDNPDVAEIYPAYSKDMIKDELRQTILPKKEFVPINVDYSKAEIDVYEIKGKKRVKIKIPYKDKEGYFEKFSDNPKYNDMSDEEILKDMVEGVKKANYGRSVEVEPAKFDTEKLMEEQKEIEKKLDREYGDYIEDTLNLSVDYLRENKGKDRELFNNKNMPYKVRRGINDLLSKYDKNAADIEMLRKMLYKHDYSKRKHAGSYGDEVWEATDTDLRPNVSKVFIRLKNPLVYDYKGRGYRDVSYSELVDKAKAEERDGLILLNTADPYESNIFVALKSTSGQVKSATGNIGTFDPQNPDIRYARKEQDSKKRRLKEAGAKVIGNKVVLYRGGDTSKDTLKKLRYGDYLSTVKEGRDTSGNEGASGYGKNVVKFELPVDDVEVINGEIQYKGESGSISSGGKYPGKIYKAYNDSYGSNYTSEEIDKEDPQRVRRVASMALPGGKVEFDQITKNRFNHSARYAQSSPSEVTLLEEPSTLSEQTYSSTTEERLTTSIFRSEGKDPIPGSIRVVEDVGKGVQKDVTAFVEDVTGKKVVWVECDTGTLVDSLGFSIDGVSFPKSIHPDLANKIFIDVNTTRPVLWTAFHEFSHFLENSPEFKKKFWEVAKLTDSGLAQRAKMGDSEFSADIVGEMMSREEFWENLKNHDRNLFDRAIRKIIEILSRLSRSLKRMLTGNEITEESRPAFERFIENSTELRNELAKALIDYNKAKGENVKETSNRLAAAVKSGQPLFAKKKPKEEFTERVSEAEKLERMTQKLRGKLRHLPKDQLKERAQIELSIQSAQAQELWHIKNAIYDYAKRIGLKGVPYNKVDTLLKNTETVSQLKKVSETLDDVWNSHVKRSAVEKLLNVIEKEYTRLKAIRGKRVSTIDRDKNRELEAYLAGLMAEPDPEAMARLNDTMEYFLSYAPKEIRKNPNWREQFKGKNLSEKHLAEITEWIEGRGTFPVFLSKDIQKAFRSNIYAMDTEQIERTIKDIEEIKKEGRTARKEKIARETTIRENNINSIIFNIGHEEDPRPQNLKNKDWRERKRLAEGIKKFGDNVLFENLRIERILNWLDGNNGLLWKSVFEPILKAEENETVNLEKALTKFEQFHKKISTKEALSEVIGEIEVTYEVEPDKFKSEKIKITADHGMFVYANSQNPGNLEHLEGTGYTKEHIAQITEALPEKYKNAVDDLITYFDEEQYPRTNIHFAEEHEVDMPKVHRYFPVRNLASERSANAAATSDILMRYGLNRASVKKGHTKTRVMSKAPFRNESYFETALQSIIDAEHYIAFNTPVREVSRYIYDPRIKDAIKEKSSAAYREIRKWIRDSSHGRIAPPETSLDNVANYIRNNYSVAVLGGNLITIMKQPASFSQGLHHIKKKKYAGKAAVDFLVETLKMASKVRNIKDLGNLENSLVKKVQDKSVMMKYRPKSVERYYAEQIEKGRFRKTLKIEGGWEKLREVMMSGIQAADMATTTVLWWGRYTEVLNNTTDEYVAIKAADELIRTTQPMGGLIHLPGSFRDPSAFKRAFSMFMNQRNQNFNMLFETATQWQSHGWSENTQRIVFYILVPSVLMFAASTGGKMPWDDPEGWAEYLLDIITGGIMYYNTLASAATKGTTNIVRSLRGKRKDRFFNDFSNPVIDVVQDFNSLLANPNNIGRWIETGGKLTGLPAITQTKRVVKSFKSAVESKDPKKLVWSDYALGENGIYDAMAWRLHKATKPEEKKIYAKWYKSLSPKKQEEFKEYSVRWRKKNK